MALKSITLIFFTMILSVNVHCQWKISSGKNKFDGSFKHAYKAGKGGTWPHNEPIININKFEEGEPNLYLTNIGYTGCSNPSLSFAFDKLDEVFYFSSESNNDKDAAFFSGTIQEFSDLIKLFKQKSTVFIRYSNSCGQEDYEFSLNGSSESIEYVVGDFFKKKSAESELKLKERRQEDSISNINRQTAIREKKRLDSLQSLKTNIQLDEKSLAFEKDLMEKFDFGDLGMSKSLVKTIVDFEITETTRARYCKRLADGLIYRDNEIPFYKSDTYRLLNRIDEGCIKMVILDSRGKVDKALFISNTELQKLTNDYRIKVISKNWLKLINTED